MIKHFSIYSIIRCFKPYFIYLMSNQFLPGMPGTEAVRAGEIRVTVLGSGNPPPTRAQASASILVEVGNRERDMLLFDVGSGSLANFMGLSLPMGSLEKVFLTHLHHDHCCDFPLFAITGWMWSRKGAPIVVGPKGTKHFCKHLFEGGAFDQREDPRFFGIQNPGLPLAARSDVLVFQTEPLSLA